MEKFVWTDEYNLNIHIIDEQHKHFFEIVNQIYDLIKDKTVTKTDIIKIVNDLINYGYYHLSTEEKYFNQYLYSDRMSHMKQHEMFRKQTADYVAHLEKSDVDLVKLSLEIDNFAKNWLSHHILVNDRQYVSFFKQNKIDLIQTMPAFQE